MNYYFQSAKKFAGLNFIIKSKSDWIHEINGIEPNRGVAYHLVNSYSIALCDTSQALRNTFNQGCLLPDGRPLALILKLKGFQSEQIRGIDLMRLVLQDPSAHKKHFFLGSTQNTLELLCEEVRRLNSKIEIVGSHSPPFRQDFEKLIPIWSNLIQEAGAEIVWIGLGTPKQDLIAHELAKILPLRFIAVGAAFEFMAGTKSEAPRLIQYLGFEWVFRWLQEPRRLLIRYLFGNSRFLLVCAKDFGVSLKSAFTPSTKL